jgi:hypothetical protein
MRIRRETGGSLVRTTIGHHRSGRYLHRHRGDLPDEGWVNLQSIDGKFSKVAQVGIAGTKIIDSDLHPTVAQGPQHGGRNSTRFISHAFRKLQFEGVRV